MRVNTFQRWKMGISFSTSSRYIIWIARVEKQSNVVCRTARTLFLEESSFPLYNVPSFYVPFSLFSSVTHRSHTFNAESCFRRFSIRVARVRTRQDVLCLTVYDARFRFDLFAYQRPARLWLGEIPRLSNSSRVLASRKSRIENSAKISRASVHSAWILGIASRRVSRFAGFLPRILIFTHITHEPFYYPRRNRAGDFFSFLSTFPFVLQL